MDSDTLISALHWRYAVKQFDASKDIPQAIWETLSETLRLSPSSFGFQPWRFILVERGPLRSRLREASFKQSQVEDCSHFVVLAARHTLGQQDITHYLQHISEVRGVSLESLQGFGRSMQQSLIEGPLKDRILEWATRQVYIALGTLMTSSALLGVDACPMEGFIPERFDALLGLQDSPFRSRVACALGYRHSDDPLSKVAKVRFPREEVFTVVS